MGDYSGSVGSCLRVLRVSFRCFPRFSLALGSRGRLEGLVGKFEIVCEEFEENEGGIY